MALFELQKRKMSWIFCGITTLFLCSVLLYASYVSRDHGCIGRKDCAWMPSYSKEKLTQDECQRYCTTTNCIHAADFMLSKVNRNVEPCEDFFQFSCGQWLGTYGENDDALNILEMTESFNLGVKEVLDGLKGTPGGSVDKLKALYDSCMNKNTSELMAVSSALAFLEKLGIPDWPYLKSDFKFENMEKTFALLAAYDQFNFFYLEEDKSYIYEMNLTGIDYDYEDPQIPVESGLYNMTIQQDHHRYTSAFKLEKDDVILQVLTYFDVDETEANRTLWELSEFKEAHKNFSEVNKKMMYDCYENDSLCGDFKPFVNCKEELDDERIVPVCKFVKHYIHSLGLEPRLSEERILIKDSTVVRNLFGFLSTFPHRTIANLIAVRFFLKTLDDLNLYFRYLKLKANTNKMASILVEPNFQRWKYCVGVVSDLMPEPLTLAYAPKKNLMESTREEIKDIFVNIQHEMVEAILNETWLSEYMRKDLSAEIGRVKHKMEEYLLKVMNESAVDIYYENLRIERSKGYVENVLEARRYHKVQTLRGNNDKTANGYRPFSVNAQYVPREMRLLFGILLPPVYVSGRSKLLNTASLGSIIGHEMGHAVGIYLDRHMEMDEQTEENLSKRKKCLHEQYSNFEIKKIGRKLNPNITFHDDLADLLGAAFSRQVFNKYVEELTEDDYDLPGMNFTQSQIFYLSFAQMFCDIFSKESYENSLPYNRHSPSQFRVIGVIQNLKEFSEAFHCPVGSNMNPPNKCNFVQ